MTTLDAVRLLEEKVESAVVKIQQLQAENDALRKKCAELTNALESKTEQLSTFNSDKGEIEDGLKKALDRLNFIENSVLKAGTKTTVNPNGQTSIHITPGVSKINEEKKDIAHTQVTKEQAEEPSFDTMKPTTQFGSDQFNMEPEFDILGEDLEESFDEPQDDTPEQNQDTKKPFIF